VELPGLPIPLGIGLNRPRLLQLCGANEDSEMISKWIKVESQELQHLQIAADMLDFAATMPTGNSPEAVENRDLFVRRASLDLMASIDDIAHRTEGSAFERMGGITVVVLALLYLAVAFAGGFLAFFVYLVTFS